MNFVTTLFTSTKGHYGCKDLYQLTVSRLFEQSSILKDHAKLAHIKVSPGEETIAEQMEKWLTDKGFHVIKTIGAWAHNDQSHHLGYLSDIDKAWSAARHFEFGLWLEDDFLFNCKNLDPQLEKVIYFLDQDPDILHFRWTREDQFDGIERTQAIKYNDFLYQNNKEFSFNPCFIRPNIQNLVARFCNIHKQHIHPYCEMAYTLSNLMFANSERPFIFEDNHIVKHIGTQDFINAN